jgi:hypothetical protein
MRPILKGSTDQSVVIRIVDSGDGTPETGVVFNTAGIDLWYRREGAVKTSITEATLSALNDAHSDGGVLHIGDGYYRLDLPDAAVATGANGVTVGGTVTGMVVIGCYVPLTNIDFYLTPGAAGGLLIAGTNAPVTITGSGNALTLTSTGGDGNGLIATGNGTGDGIHAEAGATGFGLHALGGATSGAGIVFQAQGGNSVGLNALGFGGGSGAEITGGATGIGFSAYGGATSGAGALFAAQAGNSDGVTATKAGSGKDINGTLLAVTTLTTYTGNTPQTGDAYAIVNSGTHGNAALKTLIDAVDDFLDTEIAAILAAVDTEVASILAAVDTEVAAIKAKTDSLTFTVAGQVDANIQAINDTGVIGDGAGTPWNHA